MFCAWGETRASHKGSSKYTQASRKVHYAGNTRRIRFKLIRGSWSIITKVNLPFPWLLAAPIAERGGRILNPHWSICKTLLTTQLQKEHRAGSCGLKLEMYSLKWAWWKHHQAHLMKIIEHEWISSTIWLVCDPQSLASSYSAARYSVGSHCGLHGWACEGVCIFFPYWKTGEQRKVQNA